MALILDKTHTGITETIVVTGMTSGTTGITYTESGWIDVLYTEANPLNDFSSGYTETTYITGYTMLSYTTDSGIVLENPYLVIDSILLNKFNINYLYKFPITIGLFLYKDENARKVEYRSPIWKKDYYVEIDSSVFNEYFSVTGMQNTNVYKKAYEYINSLYLGWKNDEV